MSYLVKILTENETKDDREIEKRLNEASRELGAQLTALTFDNDGNLIAVFET
jgi:hypothetical protein